MNTEITDYREDLAPMSVTITVKDSAGVRKFFRREQVLDKRGWQETRGKQWQTKCKARNRKANKVARKSRKENR